MASVGGGLNVGRLYATLDLDTAQFTRGLAGAGALFAGFTAGFGNAISYLGVAAAGIQAIAGVGAVLGAIAPAAAVAIPAVLGLAQAFGTLKLAFSGVGAAISAGFKARSPGGGGGGGGGGSAAAAKARANAIKNAEQSLGDARERLADAYQSAEKRNIAAQREAMQAQKDLTKARQDALQRLQDLRREVERGSLDEREAALAVRDAERELQRVQGDSTSTADDQERAVLAYERAKNALSDTREEITNNKTQLAEMTAKGVDGSDEVVAAQERVQEANQNIIDTQIEGQRSIRDALRGVERAEDALAQARETSTAAAAGGTNAYADALAKLPPLAREFVQTLMGFAPQFDQLKEAASHVFPGMTSALKDVMTNFDVFKAGIRSTADSISSVAERAGKMFSGPGFRGELQTMMANNAIATKNFGDSLVNVLRGFFSIGAAASPILAAISGGVGGITEKFRLWAEQANASGRLTQIIGQAVGYLVQLGQIVGTVAKGLGNLFGAFNVSGGGALNTLQQLAAAFLKFTENKAVISIVQALASAFQGALGQALTTVFQVLEDLLPSIQEMAPLFSQLMPLLMLFATGPLGPVLKLLGAFGLFGPALKEIAKPLGEFAKAAGGLLSQVMTALGPVLVAVGRAFGQILTALAPLLPPIGQFLAAVLSIVPPLAQIAGQLIAQLLAGLQPLLPVLVQAGQQLAAGLVTALQQTQPALTAVIGAVVQLLPALLPLVPAIMQITLAVLPLLPVLAQLVAQLLSALMPIIMPLVQLLVNLAVTLTNIVTVALTIVVGAIRILVGAVSAMLGTVGVAAGQLVGWFVGLGAKITGAFADASRWLVEAGKKIMEGLLKGLTAGWDSVKGFVGGIAGKITKLKGPLPYDARLLIPAGSAIMGSLLDGLQKTWPQVASYLSGVAPAIAGIAGAVANPTPTTAAAAAQAVGQAVQVMFSGPVYADSAGIARLAAQIAVPVRNEINRFAGRNGGTTGLVA
jgi:phage-related protein